MAYVVSNEIIKRKGEKYWCIYIKNRIRKKKNFLAFLGGETGSGKSWSCLSIAEQLDPTFDATKVVFKGIELMKLVTSGGLKPGSVIIFEEVGVELSNRNWQSSLNKLLSYLFQTFRHRRFILIMNAPYMDFVDAATRKLFHAEWLMIKIDTVKKEGMIKPQRMQYNPRYKKFYYKWLRVLTPKGKVPIKTWRIPKPSQDLIDAYEIKKKSFSDQLEKEIYDDLKGLERGDKKQLTEKQESVLEDSKMGLPIEESAIKNNISIRMVQYHQESIKKKGYDISFNNKPKIA